jgi:nucleoside-diphosphate-sugar epimerase
MKVLVTGGTGFIGGHLLSELVREHQVCALVRDPERLRRFPFADRVQVVAGDLCASQPFPEECEAVVHLAALTKALRPGEFLENNRHAVSCFLERVQKMPRLKKVIMLSSIAAAGPSDCGDPLTEESPARPVSHYGRSKLEEENAFLRLSPLPPTLLRAPIVFGPGDLDMLDAFRLLRRGFLPLVTRGRRRFSVIYVKDLVTGILAALAAEGASGLFYLTHPQPAEWIPFLESAMREIGCRRMRRLRVPSLAMRLAAEASELRCRLLRRRAIFNRDKWREMRHPCWICSGEKARRRLHFTPSHDLDAALAETIRWYRDQGWL